MNTPFLTHLKEEDYRYVYEPAEDSFLLLDALEEELSDIKRRDPKICVEIGSGSGVNITALAKALTNSLCFGVDINPHACRATQLTAIKNTAQVEVVQMDLLSGFPDESIDLLLFNPPYVVTDSIEDLSDFESTTTLDKNLIKSWSGGENGTEIINRLFDSLPAKMSDQSVFYLLAIKENKPQDIIMEMCKRGFSAKIIKERKIRGEHLYIIKIEKM